MNANQSENCFNYTYIRENLSNNLYSLYGEEIYTLSKKFEEYNIKKVKLICGLTFLSRCRDQSVIPKCVLVKFHTNNRSINKILKKASLSLLRNFIHTTRRKLSVIDDEIFKMHIHLSSVLHQLLWNELDFIVKL